MQEQNEIYGGFAAVYDMFMDNIPYDDWFAYLQSLMKEWGIKPGDEVLELACGTGEITYRLARAGYQVTGTDISTEMLQVAAEKCPPQVFLAHQDMRETELMHPADGVICLCDGMNYLLEEADLQETFSRVRDALKPQGIFIFDMKTDYFYRTVLGNRCLTDNREDASYIWENEYHQESGINEYLLTIYELYDDDRDLFQRTDELHRQRAYPPERIVELLEKSGFTDVERYDAFTRNSPGEESERIYFIGKRKDDKTE